MSRNRRDWKSRMNRGDQWEEQKKEEPQKTLDEFTDEEKQ